MKILGIETSCDETAIAIVDSENDNFKILSDIVSSQVKIHMRWGGVVPMLAKREHQRNLVPVLKKALSLSGLLKSKPKNQKSKLQSENQKVKKILGREPKFYASTVKFLKNYGVPRIDLISVVNGPGLEPALWTGINFAKTLAIWWNKPIFAVNHLEAHLLTSCLNLSDLPYKFPFICLLVSGGHTMLILAKKPRSYKIIGETRDDSAGECFDKTARLLGLGYPGGPAIAEAAKRAEYKYKEKLKLPRPMIKSQDCDFSFSGLKTAVLYNWRTQPEEIRMSKNYIWAMASEIQQAIIDVLVKKTIRAARNYNAKMVIIGGGVAANNELRRQLEQRLKNESPDIAFVAPEAQFCTDNGVMAAIAGYFAQKAGKKSYLEKIKANGNLKI